MSLRQQLEAIYENRGQLSPRLLVEEATPEDHPLHDRFEWDDTIAGPKYREVQAAELIRSVKITYRERPDGEPLKIRAFHNVSTPDRQNYMPLEAIAEDEFARKLVLRNAEREWKELKRKYSHLQEFLSMVADDLQAKGA